MSIRSRATDKLSDWEKASRVTRRGVSHNLRASDACAAIESTRPKTIGPPHRAKETAPLIDEGHSSRFHPGSKSRSADRSACQGRLQEDLRRQDQRKPRREAGARQIAGSPPRWRHPGRVELDGLGRSVKHLVNLVGELHRRGVQFKSLTDAIGTGTASGRFFFHVMASLAEMERELTIERTQAGLKVARQLGRTDGRKRQMTESKIKSAKKLLASGVPPRDVAANLGVSVPILYRWIPASSHP